MCILMYYGPNTQPIVKHLENGAANNPDGFGWAIVHEDIVLTGHSMDSGNAIDEFIEMRAKYPSGAALFHSRITTHGGSVLENCHPFRVAGNRQDMVVAHNGIIGPCAIAPKGDLRSDTRRFAEDVVPARFMHLDSPKTRRKLEAFIGEGSKVVVLTTNPMHKAQAYIFNERAGYWLEDDDQKDSPKVGDIWYSNSSYLSSYYRPYVSTNYIPWSWNVDRAKGSEYREYGDLAGVSGTNYVRVCESCWCRLWQCQCVGTIATMWIPEHEVSTVIGGSREPFALTAAERSEAFTDALLEVRKNLEDMSTTLVGADTETDDPSTWLCHGCKARGTIDMEAVRCTECGVMYCCDQPTESCQCYGSVEATH